MLDFFGSIFNTIFLAPVINVLVLLMNGLETLNIPGSLGVAIVIMTVLIRGLVWPLIGSQMKSAALMGQLKPQLDELKKKHGKDKQAYALAQAKLFKDHGYNPVAGCLPSIIQIPLIIALYQAISSLFNGQDGLNHINYFLYQFVTPLSTTPDPYLLGLNLAAKPSDFMQIGAFVLTVPVITALLQFVQSKMMLPKPIPVRKDDTSKEIKEKIKEEDAMSAVQTQMTYMMPLMIGYFAFSFPVGLAVYWNVFSLMGIYQQYRISGWGGLENWVRKIKP